MKILLTIHHDLDPASGAPGTTLQLAEEYRRRDHEVAVWGFGECLPEWLPEQAKMVTFPWAVAGRLALAARRMEFDVIDASTGDAWLVDVLGRRLLRDLGSPLLVTRSHGLEHTMAERTRTRAAAGGEPLSWRYPLYHGGYRLWEVARSLRSADVALFLNQHDAAYSIDHLGVVPQRARVVGNGISDTLIGRPPPQPISRGGRIAVIGSYIARKGTSHAAAALNTWLPTHSDWGVTFVGTGVERAQVLADYDPSLHDRIGVVPRYANDDLPRLLEGHQVHLFPTLAEGWPKALVEAMACTLAPIVSDVPGPTEVVRDGVDSLLVPPGDPASIVAALDRLVEDRPLLDRLRANAHRTAQSHGWRRAAGERLEIYASELAHHHHARVTR